MKKPMQLKPQDIVILLKLISAPGKTRIIDIAYELGISQSEVSQGLERLVSAKLLAGDKRTPLRKNVLEFLLYGVKYVFPAMLGPVSRGVATAHSAPPLVGTIISSEQDKYVWADPNGEERGHSIIPLYPSVLFAVGRDKKLHELLALLDAIRVGRVREQNMSKKELELRILAED